MPDLTLTNLLCQNGFETEALQRAVQPVLRSQGIIFKGRYRLDATAQQRVQQCLEQHTIGHCAHPTCTTLAEGRAGHHTPLVVSKSHCVICGGSSRRRAIREMYGAIRVHGCTRLLIVGGALRSHQLLRELAVEEEIELRTVDGSGRAHSQREAAPHVAWAQALVIWGGTPLAHKVSIVYEQCSPPPFKVIIGRPGIEMLCQGVLAALRAREVGKQHRAA